jgi:hypothetical protein
LHKRIAYAAQRFSNNRIRAVQHEGRHEVQQLTLARPT